MRHYFYFLCFGTEAPPWGKGSIKNLGVFAIIIPKVCQRCAAGTCSFVVAGCEQKNDALSSSETRPANPWLSFNQPACSGFDGVHILVLV